MKKRFVHHFFIIGAGTLINILIGFFTTPIITRLVDTSYYGQLSIFNLYSGIAIMILCLGLDQALVRYYYEEENIEYKRSLLFKCIWLPIIISSIVSAIFLFLSFSGLFSNAFTPFVSIFLVLNVTFGLLYRFCLLIVRLNYKSKVFAILNILHKLFYLIFAVLFILIIKDYYYECLAVATTISIFLCMMIGIISQRKYWHYQKYDNTIYLKQMLRYSLPLMVAMGVSSLFDAIDKLSLQHFCDYSEVGIYTSALTLTSVFAIVQTTVNSLWGPASIEHFSQNPEDKSFYQRGNQIITVLMFFLGLSLIMFKDIIAYFLGSKYREAAFVLPFLVFNPIMYTISETTQIGISFMKKSKYHLIIVTCSCLLNLIGNLLLVPRLGQKGAAISTGVSYILFFTLRTLISNKQYYVDFKLCRFYLFTCFLCAYALYNTFFRIDIISTIGYVIGLLLLIVFYKTAIIDGLKYIRESFKKKTEIDS